MREELIHCPACNHQLRVPDSLFGQPVECPQCRQTFVAPVPAGAAAAVRPAAVRPVESDAPPPVPPANLTPPAVVLLLLGLLNLALNGFELMTALTNPDRVREQAKETRELLEKALGINQPQADPMDPVASSIAGAGIGLTASLLTVLAAVAMMTGKLYPLAVTGSIVAMLNCTNLCCCAGFPAGIWSLAVLLSAGGKAAFAARPADLDQP